MWHVTEGASAPLPPFLAAIASSSRAVDAPVGVKELQAAQREPSELVETSIKPHTFLATSPAVDTAIPLVDGLRALHALWINASLRPILTARHLPTELAALLQAVDGAAEGKKKAADASWCAERLAELLAHEPPLALLEALISLLRSPTAPAPLRTKISAHLSQTILRPNGVHSLVVSLMTAASRTTEAVTAAVGQAVKLLSAVPSTLTAEEYVAASGGQLTASLFASEEMDGSSGGGAAAGASKEAAKEAAKAEAEATLVKRVAAMVVGALAKRHPAACDKAILTPLIAPLVLATDGTMVTDLTAVQKLYKLLSSLPPPPAKLCNLLLGGGALVPLLNVAAYAHWLHTREGGGGVWRAEAAAAKRRRRRRAGQAIRAMPRCAADAFE